MLVPPPTQQRLELDLNGSAFRSSTKPQVSAVKGKNRDDRTEFISLQRTEKSSAQQHTEMENKNVKLHLLLWKHKKFYHRLFLGFVLRNKVSSFSTTLSAYFSPTTIVLTTYNKYCLNTEVYLTVIYNNKW